MKDQLPHLIDRLNTPPEHYSYLKHRKQRTTQIILPVVVSTLLMIGMIVLISFATFRSGGDVSRWAAISTIWIIIPLLIVGLILLAMLVGLIYLMVRALGGLPYYTAIAQDYVYIAQGYITRGADMAAKSVITIDGYIANIKELFGRITKL